MLSFIELNYETIKEVSMEELNIIGDQGSHDSLKKMLDAEKNKGKLLENK